MRVKGTITKWDDQKGFGLIAPPNDAKDVFIHITAFRRGSRRPEAGDKITFEFGKDSSGRECAIWARYEVPPKAESRRAGSELGAASVFLAIAVACALKVVSWWVLAGYIGMSLVTYFLYGSDKRAAQKDRWRTDEASLLMFGLLGGWPGSWAAQQRFRHKTRKQPFQILFVVTVILNVILLIGFVLISHYSTEVWNWIKPQDPHLSSPR